AALEKAAQARKDRAEVKTKLKHGSTTLPQVLKEGRTDEVVGKMKGSALLEPRPGGGKVRPRRIMERRGTAESRGGRGLGANQGGGLAREAAGELGAGAGEIDTSRVREGRGRHAGSGVAPSPPRPSRAGPADRPVGAVRGRQEHCCRPASRGLSRDLAVGLG